MNPRVHSREQHSNPACSAMHGAPPTTVNVFDSCRRRFVGQANFSLSVILFIAILILPFGCGLCWFRDHAVEDWPSATAFHWSVITFTTVGLGDYVPMVTSSDSLWDDIYYQVWYIFIGLMVVASILNEAGNHFRLSFFFTVTVTTPRLVVRFFRTELGASSKTNSITPIVARTGAAFPS